MVHRWPVLAKGTGAALDAAAEISETSAEAKIAGPAKRLANASEWASRVANFGRLRQSSSDESSRPRVARGLAKGRCRP